jgi:7-cyano-7-deazaguanine synthase
VSTPPNSGGSPVLVLASGGVDSTCCLEYYKRNNRYDVSALFVDYGQSAANEERRAITRIANGYQIPLKTVVLDHEKRFGSGEIQGRNAFLVFTALLIHPYPSGLISLGIHGGTAYPDCTPAFLKRMQAVLDLYSDGRYAIDAPLITFSKAKIYRLAAELEIPFALTYSCESGGYPPCGLCLSCQDRLYFEGNAAAIS